MTFTKEQLIAAAVGRIEMAEEALANDLVPLARHTFEIDLELARIALASLEAEPALYAAEETLAYAKHGELHLTCLSEPMGDAVIPLYATHPAPVVPDRSMFETWWESQNGSPFDSWDSLRTTDGYCDDGIDGQFEAWNACRAAMLRGANDSLTHEGKNHPEDKLGMVNHLGDANEKGNSPVIPEGWVMVPIEPTEDMIVNGFESEPDESFSDEKEWEVYDDMSGCQQAAHRAKLCWAAMIAAAPKLE
ncbi:hypothetical protein [Salmonella enterica]|nr:hypothetical protein [Salmonella enterica]HBC0366192.1 hypothetical protein [Salmonella enterica subsp. enterica]ANF79341.1 hypothetical protein A7P63_17730 [Salmonella enterica]MBM8718929.1 hypothetical protein [Salmonella enterica]MBM9290203.1 hypothetical protein [Salmonella enterica]MCC1820478.1 hypothetical protein [Salmonella enterica subsp. enterica serovar Indiana]